MDNEKTAGIFAHEVARQFALESMCWPTFKKGQIAQSAYASNGDWLCHLQDQIARAIVLYNEAGGKIESKEQARAILQISDTDEKLMDGLFGRTLTGLLASAGLSCGG